MPFENEHSCRLRNPADFQKDSFRRTTRKHDGKEYSIISGKLKGKTAMTEQAYRYNKDTWSSSEAKNHCEDHGGSFEAAKKSKSVNIPEGIESRVIPLDDIELRVTDGDKPKIIGYAAKYSKWSVDLGGFKEKIRPGAFDEVLKADPDVRALKNHDPNLMLGRTKSHTLSLNSNTVGLQFEIDPPDTSTGRDIIEEIRRKDIDGCSFSFRTAEDDWKNNEDGTVERTIIKIGALYDVGPVTYPAYPDTTVAARSLEQFRAKKYTCECIECGHLQETDKHCKDIKCSECGAQMRRKERPGPGQKSEETEKEDRERQREIERKYRQAGRIINRNRPAKV